MDHHALKSEVQRIVRLLAEANYREVEEITESVRLNAFMMESAIKEYGRTLVPLPEEALEIIEIIQHDDNENTASVCCPLWTLEKGRSDLSVELTIVFVDGSWRIEIDDLHVL